MTDYDLGKASGKIVITTDKRGAKQASDSVDSVGQSAERTALGFEHADKAASDWEKTARKATSTADDQAKAIDRSTRAEADSAKATKLRRDATKELNNILADSKSSEEDIQKAIDKKNKSVNEDIRLSNLKKQALKDLAKAFEDIPTEHTTTVTFDTKKANRDLVNYQKAWKKFNDDQEKSQKNRDLQLSRGRSAVGSGIGDIAGSVKGVTGSIFKTSGMALGGTALGGLAGLLGSGATGGAVSGITGISSAVAQLSGVLGALPAAIGAAATVMGTLDVATSDFMTAIKKLGDDDFEKGLKKLSQGARDTAWTLNSIYPALQNIQKGVEDAFFKNGPEDIVKGFKILGPAVTDAMNSIATSANKAFQGVFDDLTSGQGLDDFKTFLANTAQSFDILGQASKPFFEAFRSIMAVGSTFLPQIAGYIKDLGTDFEGIISKARDDGSLQNWIQTGIDATKTLIDVFKQVGEGLGNIIKIGSTGGGFLGWLDDIAKKFNEWTASASGQKQLTDFFTSVKSAMSALTPVLKPIGEGVLTIVTSFAKLGTQMAPGFLTFFQDIAGGIGELGKALVGGGVASALNGALKAVGEAFLSITTSLGPQLPKIFQGLADAFIDLAPPLAAAAQAFAEFIGSLSPGQIEGIALFVGGLSALAAVVGPVIGLIGTLSGLAVALGIGLLPIVGIAAAVTAALALLAVEIYEVSTHWMDIVDFGVKAFFTIKNKIQEFFDDFPQMAINAGKSIVDGLISGMLDNLGPLGTAAKVLMQNLSDYFPHSPAKTGPFSGKGWTLYSGQALAAGFASGIASGSAGVTSATSGMMKGAQGSIKSQGGIHDLIANLKQLNDFGSRLAGFFGDMAQTIFKAAKVFTTNPITGDSILPHVYGRTSDSMKRQADDQYRKGLQQTGGVEPGTYGASDATTNMLRAAGLNPTVGNQMGQGNKPGVAPTNNGKGTADANAAEFIRQAQAKGWSEQQILAGLSVYSQETGFGTNPRTDVVQNQNGTPGITGGFQQDNGYSKYGDRHVPANAIAGFIDQFMNTGQGLNNPNPFDQALQVQRPALVGKGGYDDRGGPNSGSYLKSQQLQTATDVYNRLTQGGATIPGLSGATSAMGPSALQLPPGIPDLISNPASQANAFGGNKIDYTEQFAESHFNNRLFDPSQAVSGTPKGLPDWLTQLAKDFGLSAVTRPDGGTLHAAGFATDIFDPQNPNGSAKMDKMAEYIMKNLQSQTIQLIHQGVNGQKYGIAGGQPVGPGTDAPGYFASDFGGHADHIHWATDVAPILAQANANKLPFAASGPGDAAGPIYGPKMPDLTSVGPHGAPGVGKPIPTGVKSASQLAIEAAQQAQYPAVADTGGMFAQSPVQDTLNQIATNTGDTADTMSEQLKQFLDGNSTLNDSLKAAKAPGASDNQIIGALQGLDKEISNQDSINTPQSRYISAQLGDQKSKLMTSSGITDKGNPIDMASQLAGGAAGVVGDVFSVIGDTLDAINSAANITDTLVRGVANTKDITKIIDNAQTFIKLAADVSKTVSDGLGMAASIVGAAGSGDPSGASSGAAAALGAASAVAGVVTSVLQSINAGIDLVQEAGTIIGKYVGDIVSQLVGGANGGLMGDVKYLLDLNTNTLRAYSADNPDDKRDHPFGNPNGAGSNNGDGTGRIRDINLYVGPGTDPSEAVNSAMWAVKTNSSGVFTDNGF